MDKIQFYFRIAGYSSLAIVFFALGLAENKAWWIASIGFISITITYFIKRKDAKK